MQHSPDSLANSTMDNGGVPALLARLAQHADSAVLCIVAETSGSTYRKPGALLLRGVTPPLGFLSGGCLEPELALLANEVQHAAQPRWIAFNTQDDDDLLFGSASGCRGLMRVLLLPSQRVPGLAAGLRDWLDGAEPLRLQLRPDGGGRIALSTRAWDWSVAADSGIDAAHAPETGVSLSIAPPPHVLIAGCGPEAPALIQQLHLLGARVSVIEHRGLWAQHASAADHRIDATPDNAWGEIRTDVHTAVLVMGHHFSNDLAHLRCATRTTIPYIGLLGPPARRDALLAELGADAERLRTRLHAPVGLRLGGEGPEAIALAIAAQLQQHFCSHL